MRVISQNGKFDLPYENLAIFVEYENVIARFESERHLLAQYSSEAKAIKAMEILRKVYENNVFYHCTASSKRFGEVQSILSEKQFQKATTEYFQFPKDDDERLN